jgi:hypothetical protein
MLGVLLLLAGHTYNRQHSLVGWGMASHVRTFFYLSIDLQAKQLHVPYQIFSSCSSCASYYYTPALIIFC